LEIPIAEVLDSKEVPHRYFMDKHEGRRREGKEGEVTRYAKAHQNMNPLAETVQLQVVLAHNQQKFARRLTTTGT
jgi:hypothetical protein